MYQPNLSDPRVLRRIRKALGFACGVLSTTKGHSWSTRYIDKFFGMANNSLSNYLRQTLLIVTDDFYRFNSDNNKCKEYKLNPAGADNLRTAIGLNIAQLHPIVLQVAQDEFLDILTAGSFEYDDKSNRLWHPLQRYRKQYKTELLASHGYRHQYDIECCAPTLIHQYSQTIPQVLVDNKWQQGPMDLYLFALRRYLNDRAQVRSELAQATELPIDAIKEIINALFAGAVISKNKQSDIYKILNGDIARIEFLQQHQYLNELKEDIRICWQYIRPVMQKRTKRTNKGTDRLLRLTSKQKWNVYFEQERVVLNSIRRLLDSKSCRYFLEHDGWSCESELDIDELIGHVKNETGYSIQIEHVEI